LGMFDPPDRVPWSTIPYSVNQSPQHDALARRAARESIVLLKNNGILPLSKSVRRVAVVGPTADDTMALLGNYYGTPTGPTTILQGIRAALPRADVRYARGADLVENRADPAATPLIETRYLQPTTDAKEHGLRGEYFRGNECAGAPVLTRTDAQVAFRWDRDAPTDDLVARGELAPDRALDADHFCIRWTGRLVPPVSGRYELSVAANASPAIDPIRSGRSRPVRRRAPGTSCCPSAGGPAAVRSCWPTRPPSPPTRSPCDAPRSHSTRLRWPAASRSR